MLDFRQNSSRRTTEGRQTQRRLLVLILMLGIVLILMDRARDPAIRRGLSRLLSPPQGPGGAIDLHLTAVQPGRPEQISPRQPVHPAGGFRGGPRRHPVDTRRAGLFAPPVGHSQSHRLGDARPSVARAGELRPVVPPAEPVPRPAGHRLGRRPPCQPVELLPNEYGIKQYYQVWLWPSDNPSAPMVVYCLRLPQGFPTGMELAEPADVTGYFFKRWAYQANDALRAAPELLARTLQWEQRPVMTPPQPVETWPIPLVVGAAALAALVGHGDRLLPHPADPAGPARSAAQFRHARQNGSTGTTRRYTRMNAHVKDRSVLPRYRLLGAMPTLAWACAARAPQAPPVVAMHRLAAASYDAFWPWRCPWPLPLRGPTIRSKPENPREMFRILGVDDSYFGRLVDGQPIDAGENETLLRVLFRLRTFPRQDIERWALDPRELAEAIEEPEVAAARSIASAAA